MQPINLDQAATSFPKAPGVGAAVAAYIDGIGANVGRGSYAAATAAELTQAALRERLTAMFGFRDASACIFTPGATFGINMILFGQLKPGDRVLTSGMEHNAVMRPLSALKCAGIHVDIAPCASDGTLDPTEMRRRITSDTRLIIMTHASNVCGTILPVGDVGDIARRAGIPLAVDAAQTAGHMPINASELNISALAVPAHKGLLGPAGLGAVLMTREYAMQLSPLVRGGTGSASDSEYQPKYLPDKFEAGTPNIPGIYGLSAAIDYISAVGTDAICKKEAALCRRMLEGLSGIRGITVPGAAEAARRMAVISVDFHDMDNGEAAYRLERDFGILTRSGLHCAPAAHKTIGTFPKGTVRFSLGAFTTEADVDAAVDAVRRLAKDPTIKG